mmetsp:Transcript_14430/g.12703  ORF Transcript_14430/g.12703 Transcript_14430/m.12703 type:complete len:181 (+) Transcript_14430:65-607(+)
MHVRENYKNKGIRKSQIFSKNMHMDYYKSHGTIKTTGGKKRQSNVLKKMKIGGKNIFKSRIIKDQTKSRESGMTYSKLNENPTKISMNLIITQNKKRKIKHHKAHSITNEKLKEYKTSDGRTFGDIEDGDFYSNTIVYPPEHVDTRNSSDNFRKDVNQSSSRLFNGIEHNRSISNIHNNE